MNLEHNMLPGQQQNYLSTGLSSKNNTVIDQQQKFNRNSSSSSSSSLQAPSKYELQNSISELFRILNVCEGKNFNRESVAERFEKSLGRQSSKPFSLFYNRLADNQKFVEQYQPLKCQNSNEVDPFVRFLVRVREDKNMSNFLNNYQDVVNNKVKFSYNNTNPCLTSKSTQHQVYRRSTTGLSQQQRAPRPSSATSALLNMVNNSGKVPKSQADTSEHNNNLAKSKTLSTMAVMMGGMKSSLGSSSNHHNQINNHSSKATNPSLLGSPIGINSTQVIDDINEISFKSIESGTTTSKPTGTKNSVLTPNHHHQHQTGNSSGNNIRKVPPYLSRDFHPCDWPKENDCFNTLGTFPVQEQEQLLLRDLLFVLIGIEGRFIRLWRTQDSNHYKLMLDTTTDHFLSVTTQRILKICYHYSTIISFVESRVYGLVNQALVASIHQHLYDYNMTICQMEESLMKNDLFLQKMFFILLPYFSTFNLLMEICAKLFKNKSIGGAVLTLLHEKTKSIQGMDNNALELCLTMTKSAAIPYFDILKTWIYYGEIADPRKEFFIEDTHHYPSTLSTGSNNHLLAQNHTGNDDLMIESDDEYDDDFGKFNDKYWDVRFRINSSKTPCFLRKHEQMIYKTGKYVSIINKVKQLFLKSSKVIPIPQSIFTNNNPQYGGNATTAGSSVLQTETTFKHPTSGPSTFMFLQNNFYGHHVMSTNNNPSIVDNSSFAYSMASSSSSNTSGHSGGGLRAHTPAPSAAIFTPKPEEIYYSFDESTYLSPIVSAYEEASSQLLHILIHESQLVETFNAVRHYMLLSMGDFIVHFMKFASKDLCKRTDSVVQHRLDSMMGMALGISVCPSDRQYLKDDPHVEFCGKSFLKQIYQIMKPFSNEFDNSFGSTSFINTNDPSPSSSYLLRCDEDAEDNDDNDDVPLNRSIISSVIESEAGSERGHDFSTANDSIDSIIGRAPKYLNKNYKQTKSTTAVGSKQQQHSSNSKESTKKISTSKGTTNSTTEQQQSLSQKLFCYESLMLKFDVPFPLSLIFTQKSIVCYELLFRYVFLCRYAEMELEETWKDNILNVQLKRCDTQSLLNQLTKEQPAEQKLKQTGTDDQGTNMARLLAKAFKSIHKKAFALRYKMIAFVRNFHYFYAFEVIDPFFSQFIGQITKRGSSLDSVIECHEKFLEHCFSSCFLTSLEITTIIIKIFTLCIELSHVLRDSIDVEDQSSMMESSCFFGSAANSHHQMAQETKWDSNKATPISKRLTEDFDSLSLTDLSGLSEEEDLIHEKLNKIYFSNRIFAFGGGDGFRVPLNVDNTNKKINGLNKKTGPCTIKGIIDKANMEFDLLVNQLLKKIYSDNCEYHMMYPFVARLDYNDFYRNQLSE